MTFRGGFDFPCYNFCAFVVLLVAELFGSGNRKSGCGNREECDVIDTDGMRILGVGRC